MFQTDVCGSVPMWLATRSFPRVLIQSLLALRAHCDKVQRERAAALRLAEEKRMREQEERDERERAARAARLAAELGGDGDGDFDDLLS